MTEKTLLLGVLVLALLALLLVVAVRKGYLPGLLRSRRGEPGALSEPELGPPAARESVGKASASAAPLVVLHRPRTTRHPIVLAHGYFGFHALGVARLRPEYFRGVRQVLEALGHTVHVARVSPTAGIPVRAAQLRAQIEWFGAERVNIIAHSMGGLDARYAITHLGLGSRVASLTTIGTPHQGTPLADCVLAVGELRRLRRMLASFGADVDGLYDLTTAQMREFNRLVVDAPDVMYASVIGAARPQLLPVNALLVPGHAYLTRVIGDNDGIVPAESQSWGERLDDVFADHWAQIGWHRTFDAKKLYVSLAERLADRGL
jgi:triacylglycerol lipase